MKICLLGNIKSVHLRKWIDALATIDGLEISVISFSPIEKTKSVTYYKINALTGSKLDYIINLLRVKRLIKHIHPDIIHAHYATSFGFMAAFSKYHPCVITGWGADIFDSPKNYFMRKILQYSLRNADAITVLSEITRKEIMKYTQKHIELVPFGVDTTEFNETKKKDEGQIRIGTIRTLSEKYGVEYLIRAVAELIPNYPNVIMDIVGDGPQRVFLHELCKTLGIKNKVIFHGFINQSNDSKKYHKLLANMDVFAILSVMDSETFGVAAVEASACAIPVVATRVGGLPEVIDDNVTGLLVPARDYRAAALALESLVIDAELRKKLGQNGRKKVLQEYNWENNVRKMIDIYKKVIKM